MHLKQEWKLSQESVECYLTAEIFVFKNIYGVVDIFYPGALTAGFYRRKKFEIKNHKFAGLSASRRVKYGYHSLP